MVIPLGQQLIPTEGGNFFRHLLRNGKHISGIINISTQSDSNNIDTVQIYVAYAHTTVKATFDWEVSLDFDKIGMSISFIPQPRTTIIAEGHATFWYNSQDFEVAPNV